MKGYIPPENPSEIDLVDRVSHAKAREDKNHGPTMYAVNWPERSPSPSDPFRLLPCVSLSPSGHP